MQLTVDINLSVSTAALELCNIAIQLYSLNAIILLLYRAVLALNGN